MKMCRICNITKNLSEFSFRKDSKKLRNDCKVCCSKRRIIYYTKHPDKYIEHKNKIKIKRYINVSQFKSSRKDYYKKNKDKILNYNKLWSDNHKDKIRAIKQNYYHKTLKNNPNYKIRKHCSRTISRMLNTNNSSKFSASILDYLPYSIEQLKHHLESLWEPWMNWNNYGKPVKNKKFWTIDHIVPQSCLQYNSMEHENFKLCWALNNLRPLEAIENIKKSNK